MPDILDQISASEQQGNVPVITPEGTQGMLPRANLGKALAQGFKHAMVVTSPEGQLGLLPTENVPDAVQNRGFQVGQPVKDTRSAPEQVLGKHAAGIPRELALGTAQNLGIPTSETPIADTAKSLMAPTPEATAAEGVVGSPLIRPLANILLGLYQSHKQLGEQAHQELQSPGLANKATGLIHLAGTSIPLIGPMAVKAGEAIGQGIQQRDPEQIAQGTGQGLGLVGGLASGTKTGQAATEAAIGKTADLVRSTPEALQQGAAATGEALTGAARRVYGVANPDALTAEQAATKALKPRNAKVNFQNELKTALPDARRAADALGINVDKMTVADAQQAVLKGKQDVWKEYEGNYLGPNERILVDTTPVANTIRQTVSDRTLEQSPALANQISKVASTYAGRELPVSELESRIQELNGETRAIEARYPTDKAAAKSDPQNAYVFAERQALNNLLTSKLDELAGPGATQLKQRYGNLKSLQDVLDRRKQVSERQAPETLGQQVGKMAGTGQMAKGTVKILTGQPFAGAADIAGGIATRKAAQASRLMNDSEYLLRQAFRKTRPSPTAVTRQPMVPMIRGLLGKGPTPLGPAPDASGSVAYVPPAYNPLTRAQRLGRLLPESTSIDLPAKPEEPMQVLNATSRVIRDPRTGKMRRQYVTSGEVKTKRP